MKRLFLFLLPLLLLGASPPETPNVLIIGDSIALRSFEELNALAGEHFNFYIIPENGGSTNRHLERISEWVETPGIHWDAIYWNAGIHDIPDDLEEPDFGGETTIEEYRANLHAIFAYLSAHTEKLLVRSSTPVLEPNIKGYRNDDIVAYNAVMREVSEQTLVPWHDLRRQVVIDDAITYDSDGVHFTDESDAILASRMAQFIGFSLFDLSGLGCTP